ncbi:WXG100 family type VII secretion target [Streptomyces carminius]|uniref:WXG100 family type VII secretion target n=1 Tax=Streptomyces carminius TaxID=2665496 RepID=UPI002FCE0D23
MGDNGKVLNISAADLKASAPTFDTQSEKLRRAAATLKERLDALGAPWGGDEQGRTFGDAYAPHRESVERAAGILVAGLAGIHQSMNDMADGHVDNEAAIEGMFTKAPDPYGPFAPSPSGNDPAPYGPLPPQPYGPFPPGEGPGGGGR